jgi:hypothetical protein
MAASNLGRLMSVATDYGQLAALSSRATQTTTNVTEPGRTEQVKNAANVGGGLPATAINQSRSTGQAGIAPAAEDVFGNWGPSVEQLAALLTEVELRDKSQVTAGNGAVPQVPVDVPVAAGMPQSAFVDFTGTGSFISFTADPADANGDGIVTSAEQMLYDSTHLFVTTTT